MQIKFHLCGWTHRSHLFYTASEDDGHGDKNDDTNDNDGDNDDDDEMMMMHLDGWTRRSHLFGIARAGHSQCRTPGKFQSKNLGLLSQV